MVKMHQASYCRNVTHVNLYKTIKNYQEIVMDHNGVQKVDFNQQILQNQYTIIQLINIRNLI